MPLPSCRCHMGVGRQVIRESLMIACVCGGQSRQVLKIINISGCGLEGPVQAAERCNLAGAGAICESLCLVSVWLRGGIG